MLSSIGKTPMIRLSKIEWLLGSSKPQWIAVPSKSATRFVNTPVAVPAHRSLLFHRYGAEIVQQIDGQIDDFVHDGVGCIPVLHC